jgi:hypothetical protein
VKTTITFIDHGARSVELKMDIEVPDSDTKIGRPTPAAILALATKAMFENGMLARAGQIALEGTSKGITPADAIKTHFTEKKQ